MHASVYLNVDVDVDERVYLYVDVDVHQYVAVDVYVNLGARRSVGI